MSLGFVRNVARVFDGVHVLNSVVPTGLESKGTGDVQGLKSLATFGRRYVAFGVWGLLGNTVDFH